MNIDFIQNVTAFTGGWWAWIWFFIFMFSIAGLSLTLVKTVENMAARTKIVPPIFYTAILLAFATSTPELMTGVNSGLLAHPNPIFAFFDNTGSNLVNMFLMCIFALAFAAYFDGKIWKAIKKTQIKRIIIVKNANNIRHYQTVIGRTFNKKDKNNVYIMWILIVLNLLLVLASYIPAFGNLTIPGLEISVVSIIPILLWFIFLVYMLVKNRGKGEKPVVDKSAVFYRMPKFFLFVVFFLVLGVLLLVSLMEADIVEGITKLDGINEIISGGLLMAVATGLPEFISTWHLFRKQHFNMVLESLVGSLWMNLLLVFFVDVSFRQAGLFAYAHDVMQYHQDLIHNLATTGLEKPLNASAVKNAAMMGPWNILSLVMVSYLPFLSTKKIGNSRAAGIIMVFMLMMTFVLGFSIITGVFWHY